MVRSQCRSMELCGKRGKAKGWKPNWGKYAKGKQGRLNELRDKDKLYQDFERCFDAAKFSNGEELLQEKN